MTNRPLVSVVIPCYQAEKYVRETIESVAAQTYNRLEVFAVDDGSSDKTLSVLNDYPRLVKVLHHPGSINRGVSLSRKLGIDHAGGKYTAFLDADDYFEPDKIEKQVICLEANPNAVLCHTAINIIGEQLNAGDLKWFNFKDEIYEYDPKIEPHYLKANWICNSSVMIKTEIMRKIPFVGNQLFQFEDWLSWSLAAEYGSFIFLPSVTTNYRSHPQSSTSQIYKNKLKLHYSHVEFYLCLANLSKSVETKLKCMTYLLEKVEDAYCEYRYKNPFNSENEVRREFREMLASSVCEKKVRLPELISRAFSLLK